MNNKFIIMTLILIFILTVSSYMFYTTFYGPKNFSLRLFIDESNTRGEIKTEEMNIIYQNNKISYANRSEFQNLRSPTNLRCTEVYNPDLNIWTKVLNENFIANYSCANFLKLYSSIEEINNAIDSHEIVPENITQNLNCHNKICYTIKKK